MSRSLMAIKYILVRWVASLEPSVSSAAGCRGWPLELKTNLRKVWSCTITERAPMYLGLLLVESSSSYFQYKILLRLLCWWPNSMSTYCGVNAHSVILSKEIGWGLVRNCTTSNVAKVRFKLYWSEITKHFFTLSLQQHNISCLKSSNWYQ